MPATVTRGITIGKPGIAGGTPILQGNFSAQAFAAGTVLIDGGAGTLERGAADLTSGIVGVAVSAGAAATSDGAFIPAFGHIIFEAFLEDFAAGTSHALVQGNIYENFALQRDTTNDRWLLDENDLANDAAVVVRLKDALTTAPARVYFVFLNAATIYV